jgi:hypothetical protein
VGCRHLNGQRPNERVRLGGLKGDTLVEGSECPVVVELLVLLVLQGRRSSPHVPVSLEFIHPPVSTPDSKHSVRKLYASGGASRQHSLRRHRAASKQASEAAALSTLVVAYCLFNSLINSATA